jgi:hypothetical protein
LGGFSFAKNQSLKINPGRKTAMSKDEILKAIQRCAKKLKRNPTFHELEEAGVTRHVVCSRWGGLLNALTAAGLAASGTGFRHPDSILLLDWAEVARKVGRVPSVPEYRSNGRFCHAPLHKRFRWTRVPDAFSRFAQGSGVEREWEDVLAMIAAKPRKGNWRQISTAKRSQCAAMMRDRPIYGAPLPLPEMMHEPVNEGGVIYAFGILARRLGFAVRRIQRTFPDCEAVREIARGQWQLALIEFEFESRNFLLHKHDPKGCDLIVCWVHNWPECPLEVIELSKVVKEFAAD